MVQDGEKKIGGIDLGTSSGTTVDPNEAGQAENVGTPEPVASEEPAARTPQDQVTKESRTLDKRMQFLQRTEGAMQAFRLPGLNRVVHDLREGSDKPHGGHGRVDHEHRHESHREEAKEKGRVDRSADSAASNVEIREGRLHEVRGKDYENYFNKLEKLMQAIAREQRPGEQKENRPLSDFEKLVIERFEQARQIEKESADGKTKFLEKTIEQWRAFFAKFADRTAKKSIDLAEVQEFLFRGLVKKSDAKAIMISDIVQNSGKAEKFARFGVLYDKLSSLLSKLVPGDLISKEAIAKGLTGEQLLYLALLPPTLEQEFLTGMKPKQGMFGLEAIEKRVSEELGITQDKGAQDRSQAGRAGRGKKKRLGAWGRMFGGDEEVDQSGQFIPWWQWGTLKRPGGFKLKSFFYSAVIIGFILVILFLINQYLMGK